jgi:PAS domain S-box-containing protein
MRDRLARVALRTSLVYGLVAAAWIVLSDRMLAAVVSDPTTLSRVQTYKGWAFVAVTAGLLFAWLRGQLRRWEEEAAAHQRAEASLRESEERIRAVVETAVEGIITIDERGRIESMNQAAAKIFGYAPHELLGQNVNQLMPPPYAERHDAHIAEYLRTGRAKVIGSGREVPGLRRDGTVIPLELSVTEVRLGGQRKFAGFLRDITERKGAEEVLRQQALLLDLAQVLVRDLDGRIVLWGRGLEQLYGYTRDEALGRIAHELLGTEFPAPRAEIEASLRRTGVWEGELVHHTRDARRVVVASRWVLHRDADGNPIHVLEVNSDITARREAEDAVRTSQARLRAALDAGNMGTWIWDLPSDRLWWDDAALKVWGRARGEMADGRVATTLALVHPDDRARLQAARDVALRGTGGDVVAEFRALKPDGPQQWIVVHGRIERDAAGRPVRMIGVCMDVTARKRAEETALRSDKLEALGTLAGGIAHDFNNVLTAIMGNLELVMQSLPPDDALQEYFVRIDRAGARAADLTRRILTFARRQDSARAVAALAPIVEEALELLRATLPAMIDIVSDVPADLPAVAVDAAQLHQVLLNLGTNAAHAMRERGGRLEVRAEAPTVGKGPGLPPELPAGRYVELRVSDNGCGMDEATRVRIFDPFFTTKLPGEGTGLGLSVVHGIMQSHGGAITVASEPGAGTTFRLYFPAAETQPAASRPVTFGGLPRHAKRVLFVDDEPDIVDVGAAILRRLGYEVTGAALPTEALKIYQERPDDFDVVVTDFAMPGMSGLALVGALREIRSDIPVILCSGFLSDDTVTAAARQLGIRRLIHKPFTGPILASALHAVFEAPQDEPG